MDLISKLERRFGSWAIPHLYLYIIALQAIGFVALIQNPANGEKLFLSGGAVLYHNQWWRLLSFMMMPSTTSPLWLFFALYIFYLVGSSLESQWGTFRFNLFIFFGYLLTVSMAFINPGVVITNTFFLGCAFLAFATLFPNVEFRLFFVLPVKVKWLGFITVAGYLLILFSPSSGARSALAVGNKLGVVAAFINYALFFGKDFIRGLKAGQRKKNFVAETANAASKARNVCKVCGKTELSHPELEFRYSSSDGECYCEEHLGKSKH